MKKFKLFLIALMFALSLGLSSCNCSGNKTQEETKDSTEVVATQTVALNVEQAISMDRQSMYLAHGGDYRWYET